MLKIDRNFDGNDILREENGEDSEGAEHRHKKVSIRTTRQKID